MSADESIVIAGVRSKGDVGPCSAADCPARATWLVTLNVRGIAAFAWVCDEHRERLTGEAR